MGFMRVCRWVLFVCAFFTFLLFFFRLPVLELCLSATLRHAGAVAPQIQIKSFNYDHIELDFLFFRLPGNTSLASIKITHLILDFKPENLLKGKLEDIYANSLELTFSPVKEEKTERKLQEFIPEYINWPDYFPENKVQVDNLKIVTGDKKFTDLEFMSLAVSGGLDTIAGTVMIYRKGDKDPYSLQMRVVRNDSLSLVLFDKISAEKQVFDAKLFVKEKRITCSFDSSISGLLGILKPFYKNDLLSNCKGRFLSNINMSITSEAELSFAMAMQVFNLNQDDVYMDHLNLEFEGTMSKVNGDIVFDISKNSLLEVAGVSGGEWQVDSARLNLDGVFVGDFEKWNFTPAGQWQLAIEDLVMKNWYLEKVSVVPGVNAYREKGNIIIGILSTSSLSASNLVFDSKEIKAIDLTVTKPGELKIGIGREDKLYLSGIEAKINIDAVFFPNLALSLPQMVLSLNQFQYGDESWHVEADVGFDSLGLGWRDFTLSFKDIAMHVNGDNSDMFIQVSFKPKETPGDIRATFEHSFVEHKGMASLSTYSPLVFAGKEKGFGSIFDSWSQDYDLTAGEMDFIINSSWSNNATVQAGGSVTLKEGVGFWSEKQFDGLFVEHDFLLLPRLQSVDSGTFLLEKFNAGVELENINAKIRLYSPENQNVSALVIDSVSANIFTGNIFSEQIDYNFKKKSTAFDVNFQGVDLAEIMKTQKMKSVSASGKINGILPVQLDHNGIEVIGGEFVSVHPGGLIEYQQAGGDRVKSKESLTGIVLKSLQEFYYDTLEGSVDYARDGKLDVQVHMEGVSPALETNRPVHLNVNMEQNILSLLKSLRYSKIVTKELDKKIKQRFQSQDKPD